MRKEGKCKECGKPLPGGNGMVSWTARMLGFCRYCYRGNYPRRNRSRLPHIRQGSRRILSSYERVALEKVGFNQKLWSYRLRRQMKAYWRARERKEVNI